MESPVVHQVDIGYIRAKVFYLVVNGKKVIYNRSLTKAGDWWTDEKYEKIELVREELRAIRNHVKVHKERHDALSNFFGNRPNDD